MRLILAEKRSMADAIAAGLGVTTKGPHYEGMVNGKAVAIAWAQGHLVELLEPDDYTEAWKTWSWSTLPMVPSEWKTRVIRDSAERFKVIKELLPKATELVVATDPEREGELIADLILTKAGFDRRKPTFRLWIPSLTPKAIGEAYGSMKPWSAYQGLRDAAHGRARADWLVGMSGTRALTLLARSQGHAERGSWPVGRVMTPTLALLVQREKEIQAFVPQDFWTLEAQFNHVAGTYKGTWFKGEETRFKTAEEAAAVLARIKGNPGEIVSCEVKPVSKPPEQFYSLAAIQQEAGKRFRLPVDKTLEIVASLYEAQVLSYPRTSSRHLTEAEAVRVPTWIKTLSTLPAYAPITAQIEDWRQPLGKRFVDDSQVESHTALMPTDKAPNWEALSEDQRKIYDLVARRFLAAFFPNRLEEKTVLVTEVLTHKDPETFKSTGTVVKDLGWSKIDAPAKSAVKKRAKGAEEDEEDTPLSVTGGALRPGDVVTMASVDTPAKKTTPPKRLTDADLIRLMLTAGKDLDDEDMREAMRHCKGIGTEATRAAIISKLLSKGTAKFPREPLVVTEKGFLVPTSRGIRLIDLVPFKDLTSAELTARWEMTLDELAGGKGTLPGFMEGIEAYAAAMVQTLRGSAPELGDPGPAGSTPSEGAGMTPKALPFPCPKCGSKVYLKGSSKGFYTRCESTTRAKCYFGFDADSAGNPILLCKAPGCEKGRVKTTPNGSQVCADCEAWQDKLGSGPNGSSAPAEPVGTCPKCKTGTLKVRTGAYGLFTSCSDRACGVLYDSDQSGKPLGGACKACGGPVKKVKSGNRVCVVCDTWQDAAGPEGAPSAGGRPPKPADQTCGECGQVMKTLFTKRGSWSYRCEGCQIWINTEPLNGSKGGRKPAGARR